MVIFHSYVKLPEGKLAGTLSRLPSHRHPWVCAPHPSWSLLWRQRFRCRASRDSNVLTVAKPGNLKNRCQDVSKTWKLEHICQGHLVAYCKLLSKYWMEVSTNVGNVEPEKLFSLGGKLSLSRKSQPEKTWKNHVSSWTRPEPWKSNMACRKAIRPLSSMISPAKSSSFRSAISQLVMFETHWGCQPDMHSFRNIEVRAISFNQFFRSQINDMSCQMFPSLRYVPQRHRVPRIANLRSPDRYPGYSWETDGLIGWGRPPYPAW